MKAILIIGGSRLQLPAIQWAKEMGLHVAVTDKDTEVPGAKRADEFHHIEGTNTEKLLALARDLSKSHQFIGAYGGSDFSLTSIATLGEAFDLPYPSINSVKLALNKRAAKQVLDNASCPTPAFRAVSNSSDALKAAKEIGFPVIIKPMDASGSRGISTVMDVSEIGTAVENARKFSPTLLIEEYIRGRHIDVNGLFWDGEFYPCGTDERFFSEPPLHLPLWLYQPAAITANEDADCYRLLEQAARALGINIGPVKGDFILTEEGPVILELAPRFHGEVTTAYVTPVALKVNPIKFYLTALSGLNISKDWLKPTMNGFAGWRAIFPQPGTIQSISGKQELLELPGIYDLFLKIKSGDSVKKHLDNRTVAGFIWSSRPSVQDLRTSLIEANRTLSLKIQ